MRRPCRAWSAAVLACLGLMVSCGGSGDTRGTASPDTGEPRMGGALVDYQNWAAGPADHIDPALASTTQGAQPAQLIFDGLTDYDYRTGELKPAVAASWSSDPEAKVWTFRIRPGVTFSNGDPVLPSDFKFAWERVVQKDLASRVAYHVTDNLRIAGPTAVAEGRATEISGLRADDANLTLTVALEAPLSFVPEIVAHTVFSPVPRKVVQALPDQTRWENGTMIGNGPYRMAEPWKPDTGLRLVRNETYWGGVRNHPPYLDTIEFRVSKDLESAWAAFEAGQGHTAYIPPAKFSEVKSKYPGHVAEQAANGLYFWAFNMKDPVVGGSENVKLRQAITLAIDKQRMITDIYNNSRKAATGITPPGIPGFKGDVSTFAARDLARARQAVADWERSTGKAAAGIPTIRINYAAGAGHAENAAIIQANLKELGIRSDLDSREPRTYFSAMRKGEGQFFASGWVADYNAYDNMLFPLFASSQVGVGDNLGQYSSARFDALIDEARRTPDVTRRNDLYHQAESLVLDQDTAVVPLNWYAGTIAWSAKARNVVQSALLFVAYDEMWLAA